MWSPKTYRLLVPHQVSRALGDLGNKVENEDEDHNEWTNHSPCHLPEDIGLVADHELNIFVEPAEMWQRRKNGNINFWVFLWNGEKKKSINNVHALNSPTIADIISGPKVVSVHSSCLIYEEQQMRLGGIFMTKLDCVAVPLICVPVITCQSKPSFSSASDRSLQLHVFLGGVQGMWKHPTFFFNHHWLECFMFIGLLKELSFAILDTRRTGA